ncbi:MAG: Cna B-type domain-containing protein, partial [Oscillospiraceae bacterium]|nr:Cna B-type domain-containing protein [Oscillospiraceae bacterium]
ESSDWSLFYTGLLGIREAKEAIIENRLSVPVSPSPLPTAQPSPEPSPLPLITLSVEKVWLDRDDSQRSENASVELYRDGELWQTLVLNEENDWTQSLQVPGKGESWTVKEVQIPEGYSSEVTREGNHFTVTNTSKDIPATGDVSAFEFYAVSSALCMMILTVIVGFTILVKRNKTD